MSKPILYLMVGYPGAGKTTIAKLISKRTGAVHLWADAERHNMFDNPSHTTDESVQLYEYLNHKAAELLENGQSVVFDTNFNFASDRNKLRIIADERGAITKVIWLTTPVEIARQQAVHPPAMRNGYMFGMTENEFNSIVSKLEPPAKNENVIKIDRSKLDADSLLRILGI
jgi:predicted kinase